MAEPTRDEICAAIRRRLNAGKLPKLERDVFVVFDSICQRGLGLEDVAGLTAERAQEAWASLVALTEPWR
jgi:hypothetical protein